MKRSYGFVLALAIFFILPFGSVRGLVLLVGFGFACAVTYAARLDLRERSAPSWAWLTIAAVSLALTPLGGFLLWMLSRLRWRRTAQGLDASVLPVAPAV